MAAKLALLMANLSLCYAACLSPEVWRIQNPDHQAYYSPPYPPAPPTICPEADSPRLLVIGDVHGMLAELQTLLDTADFSPSRGDRVIFAGDLINKGPESAGVIDLAMELNATGVRGNHEDRVLRTWAGAEIARTHAEANGTSNNGTEEAVRRYEESLSSSELKALATARTLTPEQRAWSADLPVTLRLGDLPGFGETAVVHGGMAPGVGVADQDPWAMYNVRSLLRLDENDEFHIDGEEAAFEKAMETKLRHMTPGTDASEDHIAAAKQEALDRYGGGGVPDKGGFVPIDTNDGQWWVEVWNEAEKAKKPEGETLTLFYGHDSKRGIQIHDYSFGLDSKCVDGFQLTALVLEPEEAGDGLTLKHHLVSVDCPEPAL